MKKTSLWAMTACLLLSIAACSSNQPKDANNTATEKQDSTKVDSTAVYECPMQCEGSKSDKPGTCPECGMELEKIKK